MTADARAVGAAGTVDGRAKGTVDARAKGTVNARAKGTVLLAAPRGFCAGVDRAVLIVEQALERFGPPVYVRRQIVHNTHVVAELGARGAVFVEELGEVPAGSVAVLSAHGVAPSVRAEAEARELTVIDATCPLVAKVHAEALRFARDGYTIALIGHEDHEEVVGTRGEVPESIRIVSGPADVEKLELELGVGGTGGGGAVGVGAGAGGGAAGAGLVWLSQTTLAVDEVAQTADALRARFPRLVDPPGDDICYASQNRQNAVKAIAARCDLLLVVGSANSSNSIRLVEVARGAGARAAYLVDDGAGLRDEWFAEGAGDGSGGGGGDESSSGVGAGSGSGGGIGSGAGSDAVRTVGVTAGASAPEYAVRDLLKALARRGFADVEEVTSAVEEVTFELPARLRAPK